MDRLKAGSKDPHQLYLVGLLFIGHLPHWNENSLGIGPVTCIHGLEHSRDSTNTCWVMSLILDTIMLERSARLSGFFRHKSYFVLTFYLNSDCSIKCSVQKKKKGKLEFVLFPWLCDSNFGEDWGVPTASSLLLQRLGFAYTPLTFSLKNWMVSTAESVHLADVLLWSVLGNGEVPRPASQCHSNDASWLYAIFVSKALLLL